MKKQFFNIKSIWPWIIAGISGLVLFFTLIEHFDFMANAPVSTSKKGAIEQTTQLFQDLGIETDTLGILPFRLQRVGTFTAIKDSLKSESPTPGELNQNHFFLHGWEIIAAKSIGINETVNLTSTSIYESIGLMRVRWDNAGKPKLLDFHSTRGKPPHILGENNLAFATELVTNIFGYNLEGYSTSDEYLSEVENESLSNEERLQRIQIDDDDEHIQTYRWIKRGAEFNDYIELELESAVREDGPVYDRTIVHGVTINRFEAYNEAEKIPLRAQDQDFTLFFIITIVLVVLFVFIEGFSQLFKGKVDWNRILLVAVITTLFIYGWRYIYLSNFSDLLNRQINLVLQFNMIIYGLVMGLFAGIAYLGWEAYVRSEKKYQIDLIDAYWRRKFFLKETGSGRL